MYSNSDISIVIVDPSKISQAFLTVDIDAVRQALNGGMDPDEFDGMVVVVNKDKCNQ